MEFEGRWPAGIVRYQDPACPIKVKLTAFSPFVPLDLADSTLPVTVMRYTLRNRSDQPVSAELVGWLENAVLMGENNRNEYIQTDFSSKAGRTTLFHHPSQGGQQETALKKNGNYGSMALSFMGQGRQVGIKKVPAISTAVELKPGEQRDFTFLISWHFPAVIRVAGGGTHHYARWFKDAEAVADYVGKNIQSLSANTERWVKTWNDSTLPQWLLDRTMAPATTLQTASCIIGNSDRFWAWEGIGAGQGTCTHVWGYAQTMARLFPSLERNLREKTDFAIAQLPNGAVPFRIKGKVAIDGQCGTVLRSYREHQISSDSAFLKHNWPKIKLALEYLINFDHDDGHFDGLLDGEQHNTLDAEWYGKVHVLCSLYLAALRAGEEMAMDIGDKDFETLCRSTFEKGSKNIESLFNGEYYVQLEDPNHTNAIGVGTGVYIDQVYGQFWANQVGLGPLYNQEHMRSSLNSIWTYNFLTDVGPFREQFRPGRFYAWKGDGGLLMCTWPNGGVRDDYKKHWQYGYFNECMSGFEYQVAAHMVSQGDAPFVEKGLAIARTIHDRYAPQKRNPYNEIEFSDHYARPMSAYGVFLAACGFSYNGPEGMIAFDPVIGPEDFRAPFTAAEGWGTFSQRINRNELQAELRVNWGSVSVQTLLLNPKQLDIRQAEVTCNGKQLNARLVPNQNGVMVELAASRQISAGQSLKIVLH